MTIFVPHSLETAPEKSRAGLRLAERRLGFVPNMLGVLAESPAALEAYQTLQEILGRSSFTPAEQQFLALVVSVANGCTYCAAVHSLAAENAGLARDAIAAVRDGGPIADARLQALRRVGFTKAQVLEVLVAAAMKLITNYADHIADVPLDAAFQPYFWKAREAA